ncbi:MAG TPA: hypothetical protein VJ385_13175 [Fibrobacteria bacterium]|nr:hypothetical protein [Fibrobacteria bacterium]
MDRFRRFLKEENPAFTPYIPSGDGGEARLLEMDLPERLGAFPAYRAELLGMIRSAPSGVWGKRATHPEYSIYTPEIMVRHIMMHDCLHMYRIEELWITEDAFLPRA